MKVASYYYFYFAIFIFSIQTIMKFGNIIPFLICIMLSSCNQKPAEKPAQTIDEEAIVFDSLRAAKAGADDYGMKQYVMAFLKRGPNRDRSKEEAEKLQRAHMDNIGRLAEEGKLVLAGPFLKDGDLRGIYIFDVKTEEEAKILVETDPAIKAGSLVMELVPWYGSAALMEVGEIHKRIAKVEI